MQEYPSGEKRHYGFDPFGYLYWLGSLAIVIAFAVWINAFIARLMFPQLGIGVIVLFPFWLMSALPVIQIINYFTPVTIDAEGLWIRVFPNSRRFIPWEDVQRVYQSMGYDIVYVRYVSPFHWFLGAPFEQSFTLVFGLDSRDELVKEIVRRASKVQGREVPLDYWGSRLF